MSDKPLKTHQECPFCGHDKCFTIWADGGYYCHSCGEKKGDHSAEHSHKDSSSYPTYVDPRVTASEHRPYRNVLPDVVEFFDIKTGLDSKGNELRREYVYPHATKYRYLPKDFSKNLGFKTDHLFGMDKYTPGSQKTITIVEGEDDVPAAYQMLSKRQHVVGLPGASVSSALIHNCSEFLNAYEEIIVCTDGDDAGDSAANKLATAFPNKVFIVNMRGKYKDPQEFLASKKDKDFFFAWNNRKKFVPSGFWNTPDQFVEILEKTETHEYVPTYINELDDTISGIMQGHLTVLTGPEGQGKTEILRYMEYQMLSQHPDKKIGVLHMEESKKTCLESYACYVLDENLRDPDHTVPQTRINSAIQELTKNHNLFLFDFHIDEDPLAILDKVRYLSVACECDYIFIDPIQQLAYGKDMDDTEEKVLSRISVQLERLANDLNVGIIMTTHVNDDGQTRSSRMIGKSASVRIDLNRDHMNTDPDVRNITTLSVSKNRPTGKTGYGGQVKFDPSRFTLESY